LIRGWRKVGRFCFFEGLSAMIDRVFSMLVAGLGDVHGRWREALALEDVACAEAGVAVADLSAIFQVDDADPQRAEAEADQVPGPAKYRKLGDYHEVVGLRVAFLSGIYIEVACDRFSSQGEGTGLHRHELKLVQLGLVVLVEEVA
jgi:hypothetical protein